jgi:putative transposase
MAQNKRPKDIVRTDKWQMMPTIQQRQLLLNTVVEYRRLCRALIGVIYTHWHKIGVLDSQKRIPKVERLIHSTSKNPNPTYSYFGRSFYKFPSYYRRAAIQFAIGQVSSFVTRYNEWQRGKRARRDAKPPRLNGDSHCYPSLYQGQCILFEPNNQSVRIKVYSEKDWVWIEVTIFINSGSVRHLKDSKKMSPSLIVNSRNCHLSVPFKCKPDKRENTDQIISVDLGINYTAVVSVVTSCGTVLDRYFIHPGRDIDRRDKRLKLISKKAGLSKGKLHKGFCKNLYRKASNINQDIAHKVSRKIVNIAESWNSLVIVFEYLKGWKPKGGRKRSTLKQRFHGWLHRRITEYTEMKWIELGGKVAYVNPAYTSKFAFDGSGVVKRGKANYELATFKSGKQYNCDLNATYNIAAKYWLVHKKDKVSRGKSSTTTPRSRAITLSMLWESR